MSFQDAIVYAGTCFSIDDPLNPRGLGNTILRKGAAIYLGFSGMAPTLWASQWLLGFFSELSNGETVKQSFSKTADVLTRDVALASGSTSSTWYYAADQAFEDLTITWGCSGFYTGDVSISQDGRTYHGIIEVQHRIRQISIGRFGAEEIRAYCWESDWNRFQYAENPPLYAEYIIDGVGTYSEVYPGEPQLLFEIPYDNSSVTLYDTGLFPQSGTWVTLNTLFNNATPYQELGDCDTIIYAFASPYEVWTNDGLHQVTINDEVAQGSMHFIGQLSGMDIRVKFKYNLQQ